ncbi:MAG: hypothetical protein K0U12_00595 [Gammaproteobacteria bacterium]|nr:hypothetical protein [Gammaproteobacteria bacterium]
MRKKYLISIALIIVSLFSASVLAGSLGPVTEVQLKLNRLNDGAFLNLWSQQQHGGVYTLPATTSYPRIFGLFHTAINAFVPNTGGDIQVNYESDFCCAGVMTIHVHPNQKTVTVSATARAQLSGFGGCEGLRKYPKTDCFPSGNGSYTTSYALNKAGTPVISVGFKNNCTLGSGC